MAKLTKKPETRCWLIVPKFPGVDEEVVPVVGSLAYQVLNLANVTV